MRTLVSILTATAIFAGCIAAWWFYWPIWRVESHVREHLRTGVATFSSVKYNRATGAGCGYVNAADSRQAPSGTTHFILLPDGSLKFDPSDRVTGNTLQQLEAIRKHSDYLALVYARCG
ncbi:hypothetical protein QTH90_03590 [Variovorax sp. J2P1-59]|uniref:hypothetical protein n=1 Tax=Variovorax flavidus TaxID=3053501 RepID=UPI002577D4EE|nr:hypothetical protein [Variovorax sp. J2P1-59]MDM0073448.1 hypothetical protein [Variovorax sp. J2P1-59]